jgi:hypothetical protein
MDELEWLKEHSPSTRPSREVTRRHRTQLRAAIAAEGAEGTRPRRPRRERRSRHRVLFTSAVVVAVCAIGAGVIALTSTDGGDGGSTVGAPASTDAATSTVAPPTCAGPPPKQLAVPAGFGNPVAAPAKQATSAPAATQQVTSWSSDRVTIEQRWPADPDAAQRFGVLPSGSSDGSFSGSGELIPTVDDHGVAHRTTVYTFGGQAPGCEYVQVTVYGADVGAVDALADSMASAPFRSNEPLVATTAAALAAPSVVACEGAPKAAGMPFAAPVGATVGGPVTGGTFTQPADALADFLAGRTTLARSGYRELRVADSSVAYAKDVNGKVVTIVHVVPAKAGWTVADWQASGC